MIKAKFLTAVILLFIAISLFNSCKKKSDWRDAFVASYVGPERHEKRLTNFVTGQAYYYVTDSLVSTNVNMELIKNGKSDQITFRLDGVYYCDADKDGYTTKANATVYYTTDSIKIVQYIPTDTFNFGRFVWVGKRNN
jgi:hypothetical protein